MAILTYTVTLAATATRAVTAWTPIAFLRIENEASNAVVKFGPSTVSSTSYGGAVIAEQAAASNAVTIGPFDTNAFNLEDIYFLGTDTQKIHLTAVQV